ncbi:hypothetical protein GN244_ATG05222 [Phytophthora infestans]|uniref:Uncharacterized protein n=1 Tax=Phytophthora infestans TaxID=4787 RepID=A0A833WHV9_PHYIN|nr:hypothetical protein GN244_ATG05222 [Phytophthora infestans]KAF4150603.1 hypothetical protein GN958_ATG00265 [Phytophthora infestans]
MVSSLKKSLIWERTTGYTSQFGRTTHQSDEMHVLEQQIQELREHYEAVRNKASELEQDVEAWQNNFKEK